MNELIRIRHDRFQAWAFTAAMAGMFALCVVSTLLFLAEF